MNELHNKGGLPKWGNVTVAVIVASEDRCENDIQRRLTCCFFFVGRQKHFTDSGLVENGKGISGEERRPDRES